MKEPSGSSVSAECRRLPRESQQAQPQRPVTPQPTPSTDERPSAAVPAPRPSRPMSYEEAVARQRELASAAKADEHSADE